MRRIYFLIFVFAINAITDDYNSINLSKNKEDLSSEIYTKLESDHYLRNKDKTNFNRKYIEALIERLDKNKNYFMQDEINNFIERSKSDNKDDFDIELGYELINLYFEKLIQFSRFQIELVENNEFDFFKDEYLDIFYEDNKWALTPEELEELWRLETKNDLLIASTSDSSSSKPTNDLVKRYKNRIRRIHQQKEEDIFSLAINTLSNQFDPHSSYLSPRSAEDFDLNMSLKLNGIGALLGVEDDYTKIISLVPGGPAEKSGKIKPEDLSLIHI